MECTTLCPSAYADVVTDAKSGEQYVAILCSHTVDVIRYLRCSVLAGVKGAN